MVLYKILILNSTFASQGDNYCLGTLNPKLIDWELDGSSLRSCLILQKKPKTRFSWPVLVHVRTEDWFSIWFSHVTMLTGSHCENWVTIWELPNTGMYSVALQVLSACESAYECQMNICFCFMRICHYLKLWRSKDCKPLWHVVVRFGRPLHFDYMWASNTYFVLIKIVVSYY